MKINVITCPFGDLPPQALGAVEKLFYQLARSWATLGHEVCFVCAGGGDDSRLRYVRLGKFCRTGRTLTDLPLDFWYSLKAVLAMPKCDVLVCNTFWSPILAPLVRWKYKKLIYGVHRYPRGQFWLYRFVHSFICVSTVIGEAVCAQSKSASKKVKVICNPIDTSIFKPSIRGDGGADDVFNIVYSGRIAVEKGLVYLARAVQKLSDDKTVMKGRKLRLVLVGPWASASGGGGESYRKEIRDAFSETVFVGPIYEPQKLADYIRAADVYCYPTIAEYGEAMPVAPLEAMACGALVVLPRFRCFADYAQDGVNCLMYDKPEDLVDVVRRLSKEKELAMMIASEASATATAFSVEVVAKKYLQAFKS